MKPLFEGVSQIGLVVKDVRETVRKYTEYGIGPWKIWTFDSNTLSERKYYGKDVEYGMLLAIAYLGDMEMELIQPTDDSSVYADFLKEHGEGIHHLKFKVTNYNETLTALQDKGLEIVQEGNWCERNIYAYVDIQRDLKLIGEFADVLPGFVEPPSELYPPEDK